MQPYKSSTLLRDEIQPCTPNTDDAIQGDSSEGNLGDGQLYPEITRVAIEIGLKGRIEYNTDAYPILNLEDPVLDPTSTRFEPRKWIEVIISTTHESTWKFRRISLLFKSLNILGSVPTTQKPENVVPMLLSPFRSLGVRRKGPKRNLLYHCDGLVRSGEMLLVLGKPGSGCSSLLKTIAGQSSRLNVAHDSVLHYNGKSF